MFKGNYLRKCIEEIANIATMTNLTTIASWRKKYAIKYRKNIQQIKRKFRFIKKKGKEGPLEVRKFRESKKKISCYQKTDLNKYRENKNDNKFNTSGEYFSVIGSCSPSTPAIGR